MRLMALLFCCMVGAVAQAEHVRINDPATLIDVGSNAHSYRFFFTGHTYGHHKSRQFFDTHQLDYPAISLLRNLDILRTYDFGILGGDVVQYCNPASIRVFEETLLHAAPMPWFNAAGNHDKCFQDVYDFPEVVSFSLGQARFVILSSATQSLDDRTRGAFFDKLDHAIKSPGARYLMVFSHRPLYMASYPELASAAGRVNYPVKANASINDRLIALVDRATTKSIELFWFSGDVGMHFPLLYFTPTPGVHLIASALYENEWDHIIGVSVDPKGVELEVVGLTERETEKIETYNPVWLSGFFEDAASIQSRLTLLIQSLNQMD